MATFRIVDGLGMFDSLWAPILLYTGTDIVSICVFLQFVRSVPVSLDEAARVEGAGALTIYRKIMSRCWGPRRRRS